MRGRPADRHPGMVLRDLIDYELVRLGKVTDDIPVAKSTVFRLRVPGAAFATRTCTMFDRMFGWPMGFARYVLDGDIDSIEASAARPDLRHWVVGELRKCHAGTRA